MEVSEFFSLILAESLVESVHFYWERERAKAVVDYKRPLGDSGSGCFERALDVCRAANIYEVTFTQPRPGEPRFRQAVLVTGSCVSLSKR